MPKPEKVLQFLAADLEEALGDEVLSVAVHGSWALGDFTAGQSDLDVLVVMATDTTAATLAAVHDVHARLDAEFPEWGDGYVEVEYVSVEAIRAVVPGTDEAHPMISVGKGEPLHALGHHVGQTRPRKPSSRPPRAAPGRRVGAGVHGMTDGLSQLAQPARTERSRAAEPGPALMGTGRAVIAALTVATALRSNRTSF